MNRPIGIFDSGIGGLSVWKEVVKILPYESIIYYADSANCPYGSKSVDEIISLTVKNVDFLLKYNCKLIIVACNTATAAAIDYLRAHYEVPFVGMEPAVKPAAIKTNTKSIGILATQNTFKGKLFQETSSKFAKGVKLYNQIGYKLVEFVENDNMQSPELKKLLYSYLKPMLDNNVDNVVLGCTHYPFLIEQIKEIVGNDVQIIDPSSAVAKRVKYLLKEKNIISNRIEIPEYIFFTNSDKNILQNILKKMGIKQFEIILTSKN